MVSQPSDSRSPDPAPARPNLSPRFCAQFDGVCSTCPNKSGVQDPAAACNSGDALPPLAELAIAELARCRQLTERERDVLTLCCCGAKNTLIAQTLGISVSAVRRHLRHLHRKTNTSDKAELILNLWHSCAAVASLQTLQQPVPA